MQGNQKFNTDFTYTSVPSLYQECRPSICCEKCIVNTFPLSNPFHILAAKRLHQFPDIVSKRKYSPSQEVDFKKVQTVFIKFFLNTVTLNNILITQLQHNLTLYLYFF